MKKKLLLLLMTTALLFCGCSYKDIIHNTSEENSEDEEAVKDDSYYFELEDAGTITEQDYNDWATYYADLGDTANERLVLIKCHTLYPNDSYLTRISALPVEVTDETTASLITTAMDAATGDLMDTALEIINSDDFKVAFNDELAGSRRHSIYVSENGQYDVYSDTYSLNIEFNGNDDSYRQIYLDSSKAYFLSTKKLDDSYNGDFIYTTYATDGTLDIDYSGIFTNGICTGDFSFQYDGVIYSGNFDENGHTTVTQVNSVTKAGNVIYAYDKNETGYMYAEGTVDDFTIDSNFLGIQEE